MRVVIIVLVVFLLLTGVAVGARLTLFDRYPYLERCNVGAIAIQEGQAMIFYDCGTVSLKYEKKSLQGYELNEEGLLIFGRPSAYGFLENGKLTIWDDPQENGLNGDEVEVRETVMPSERTMAVR